MICGGVLSTERGRRAKLTGLCGFRVVKKVTMTDFEEFLKPTRSYHIDAFTVHRSPRIVLDFIPKILLHTFWRSEWMLKNEIFCLKTVWRCGQASCQEVGL